MLSPRWKAGFVALAVGATVLATGVPAQASPRHRLVSFANTSATVHEANADTSVAVAITLSAPATQSTIVKWTAVPQSGNPRPGIDYRPTHGLATIPAGSTSGYVALTIVGDTLKEPTQVVQLRLTAVSSRNARVNRSADTAEVTIIDDDSAAPPALTLHHCADTGEMWATWSPVRGATSYTVTYRNSPLNATVVHTVKPGTGGIVRDDFGQLLIVANNWMVTVHVNPGSGAPDATTTTIDETTCIVA